MIGLFQDIRVDDPAVILDVARRLSVDPATLPSGAYVRLTPPNFTSRPYAYLVQPWPTQNTVRLRMLPITEAERADYLTTGEA